MQDQGSRKVPRPFSLHWGGGQIVEEASFDGLHHGPAVQLMEFDDGSISIRFCYYSHTGRFQRSPLMLGRDEIAQMRDALAQTPRLRTLLREMVED